MSFGTRATVYPGDMPLREVLASELAERRSKSSTALSGRSEAIFTLLAGANSTSVSADGEFQDNLIGLLRGYSDNDLHLLLAEYQP